MATFALFDEVVKFIFVPGTTGLTNGPIDFGSAAPDVFRIALSNTAIGVTEQASYDYLNDVTQIAATGGYTTVTNAAGAIAANPAWSEPSSGVWQFTTDDIVFTATAGGMPTFRYPVLVSTTTTDASNNPVLIGFLDHGSGVTLADGNTFTVNVGTNGWFQITVPNFA